MSVTLATRHTLVLEYTYREDGQGDRMMRKYAMFAQTLRGLLQANSRHTTAKLAEKLKVHDSAVRHWLLGDRLPSEAFMPAIAAALDLTPADEARLVAARKHDLSSSNRTYKASDDRAL